MPDLGGPHADRLAQPSDAVRPAKICEECATDCERIGGVEECVAACRACAKECRQIASRAMAA